jgi:hypothetical protein
VVIFEGPAGPWEVAGCRDPQSSREMPGAAGGSNISCVENSAVVERIFTRATGMSKNPAIVVATSHGFRNPHLHPLGRRPGVPVRLGLLDLRLSLGGACGRISGTRGGPARCLATLRRGAICGGATMHEDAKPSRLVSFWPAFAVGVGLLGVLVWTLFLGWLLARTVLSIR